jgi:CRISPR-associated protein Cas2
VLSQYGDHLQLSVVECQLNEKDLVVLRDKLNRVIQRDEDQVLLIRLGPVDGRSQEVIEAIGREYKPTDYSWGIV